MAENYYGITDTGKMRDNNEDTFIAETIYNGEYIAACVIDGVGGYAGGEVASRLAREAILQHLHEPKGKILTVMQEAFAAANEAIFRERQLTRENGQMACVVTLALVDLKANKFYYAHVGDTRLYLFRDNSLVKISHDHSFVGYLEDSGRLTEEEAMRHPKRNEINKALGFDGGINPGEYLETGESPFLPGDMLLLCSDGLSDMVDRSGIIAVLNSNKSLSAKGKTLIEDANKAGGKDNITVVLVQNGNAALKQTATKAPVAAAKSDGLIRGETLDPVYIKEVKEVKKDKNKGSGAVPLLSVLLILLLGAFIWLLFQYYQNKQEDHSFAAPVAASNRVRNERELTLIDSINNPSSGQVFIINMAGDQPLTITDSIEISNDSLHIVGNGVTLLRDTSYNGPAFKLTGNTKYVLLDSITFENFDIGLVVQNTSLHFKNVLFKNTRVPVQYNFNYLGNAQLNGSLLELNPAGSDTLPKQFIQ